MTRVPRALALAALLLPIGAAATPFRLIANPTGGTSSLAASGDHLFFWGIDGVDGPAGQPWRSDGSVTGTLQVGMFLGSSGAYYAGGLGSPSPFVYQNIAYFIADDGFHGTQLWRSDGTVGGTFALTNVANATSLSFSSFAAIANRIVFVGPAASGPGSALWASDGSAVNTQILSATLTPADRQQAVTLNGRVLYAGYSGPSHVFILTDGTAPNTTSFMRASSTYDFAVAVNEIAYFRGDGATFGFGRGALWKTDGTAGGTALVMDFSDVDDSNTLTPYALTRVDDRVFFGALRADSGRELWVSDGTVTQRVKDIHPGIIDSAPDRLVALNGKVYFSADDGVSGRELWGSDGSDAGTQPVYSFATGTQNAFDYTYDTIQAVNRKLIATVDPHNAISAAVPYVSDGTTPGSHVLDSAGVGTPNGVVAWGGKLFAAGYTASATSGLIAADAFDALGSTSCMDPEEAIPDNYAPGQNWTMRLPGRGGISKLTVAVDIGHTYVGDLSITLTHKDTGTVVTLFQPTGCSGKLMDIVLDDAAASGAAVSCTGSRPAFPRDQSFSPSQPLAAFNGEALRGDWQLNVGDHAAADVGILHEWCINFTTDLIFANSFD